MRGICNYAGNLAKASDNDIEQVAVILNNKKDAAIVFIESGAHCGGCHMKLPPQVINDAKNASKIVGCNFCGRILYNPIT